MPSMSTPKDGDFAAYLDGVANQRSNGAPEPAGQTSNARTPERTPEPQTIEQVLEGQEPTDEFIDEFNALNEAPELSDEELERQALSAPGGDGDVLTPE